MFRLELCADEHVPQAAVSALRSNGYEVGAATEARGSDTVDIDLLKWCADENLVLPTNDRDFVESSENVDHTGIIIYVSQAVSAAEFARGVRRIDRQFTRDSIQNTLTWLEEWI